MTTNPAQNRDRTPPPGHAPSEQAMLERWLEFHRDTLAAKCEGLDARQLREASAPPSGLSLLGLVRHMTDVERNWFRRVLAGEDAPPLNYTDDDLDADFRVTAQDSPEETFQAWRAEVAKAREAVVGHSLDGSGRGSPRGPEYSLRWIYLHMIEEYARHNGHADLIRERIDGAVGA